MGEHGNLQPENGENQPEAEKVAGLARILQAIGLRRAAQEQYNIERRKMLSESISLFPQSPINYILRGELYLEEGSYTLAAEDFNQALKLAQKQLNTQRFGITAQILQDRAWAGLVAAGYGAHVAEEEDDE
ncbi:MAG: hypothetical protein D6712_16900 [Chloroflexi bacterium]|nr:MAG: hypothetical protein D6712_16900 [Chloroflexota bacterium]